MFHGVFFFLSINFNRLVIKHVQAPRSIKNYYIIIIIIIELKNISNVS